jgi:hypothetical protein
MKKIVPIIILTIILNSCGKAISKITIEDRNEHVQTIRLNEGDKIKFWTKIKYKYENAIDIKYSVDIYKDEKLYKSFNYSPLHTNPRYLSSDERWIISRERNPEYEKPPGLFFNLLKFKWEKREDERDDYQKEKFIYKYGVKINVKGKNTPIFIAPETGNYTFKAKLNTSSENKSIIKRAEIILRK